MFSEEGNKPNSINVEKHWKNWILSNVSQRHSAFLRSRCTYSKTVCRNKRGKEEMLIHIMTDTSAATAWCCDVDAEQKLWGTEKCKAHSRPVSYFLVGIPITIGLKKILTFKHINISVHKSCRMLTHSISQHSWKPSAIRQCNVWASSSYSQRKQSAAQRSQALYLHF